MHITSVSASGNPGTPEIAASYGEPGAGQGAADRLNQARTGPEARSGDGVLADFTFRARVIGLIDGALYLSGRTGEPLESAAALMLPLGGAEPWAEVGDEVTVQAEVRP